MDWNKLIETGLGTLGGSLINGSIGLVGNKIAHDQAMKDLNYQWDKMYSPQAQVRNMAAAGLNPAAAFGNQAPVISGSQMNLPQNPLGGIGTTSLSDLANYMNAKANAQKSGAEIRNLDIDAKAKQFELELNKYFSAPEKIAALTLSWKNVMLKNDEHNINEWKKETEKALSQLKGIERDSAQKLLDNMDIQIELENKQRSENIKLTKEKQKTEGTQQSANRAAAASSRSQASLNEHQQQLIDYQSEFQDMVNKVKRSNLSSEMLTELKKILANRALSDAEQKEAQLRMDHVEAFINARKMSSAWREFDNACNWISSKISASISGSFSSVSKD